MLTQYNLKMPHAVYGGENAMDNITAIIKARGAKKVAMFTDKGIEGAGLFTLPEEAVKASGAEYYVLDELPPGRTPVKTRCITGKKRRDLYHFLDQEIDKGRQVYLVCPAIEDTPDGGLNAVKTYYEDIAKALLPDRRVGLMHGKLKPKEKAAVMEDFKAGRLDALVSTTVIEVGVDVPNASVMVIENAERYGLSALHQLRGRVGRGAAESWCFLVSDNTGEAVQKRLKFLCSTTDGFAVAQYDLETRGPGDFFGSRQHGLPTLQIADLMNDTRTLHAAQSEALAMLAEDPLLQAPEHALLAAQVQQMFDKAGPMN